MANVNNSNIRFLRPVKLNNALRAQLAAIDAVPGVQGWIIGNNSGDALASSLPAALDQRTLDAAGHHIARSSASPLDDSPVTEMEIAFSGGHLVARIIGHGWLDVFCQSQGDLAMARVTLSVTAAALQNDSGFQNDLRANAARS
jgi:predicted regulator of Ras-like GTPase activity (Roadblock/LC7/MglB family)